ncbi:MAG: methyltransferase domain-containing protein [Bacteroidetes bacterium]|nr:methyltransferase domain-containing protein [Bacteroidota bacterium]
MPRTKWKLAQYLESRWWRWYLHKKDPEAYYRWKLNYWENFLKILEPHLHLSPQGKYLDLGCGPAGVFMALPGKPTAVDPLLDKYKRLFPTAFEKTHGKVEFHAAKAEEYASVSRFDVVFCLNVINHVEHIGLALHNMRRLIKADGLLVISVDEHRWRVCHAIFRWLPLDVLHPYQLVRQEFEKLLHDNGFEVKHDIVLKKAPIFQYRLWIAKLRPESDGQL